ncbi:glutamate racemase [Candidatus Fermentibacteria bacterium]|nr:glutamate racemase [Candidatus Fermentibacteria bacterium]
MSADPIGVFDSGIGGLTVVRAIKELLPAESVVYFGDTARVPYGSKSPQTVVRFSLENAAFLQTKHVKLLVVACNTASSVSMPALGERFDIPFTGVIEPGVRAAAGLTKNGVVGVIGTLGTIGSGAYQKALKRYEAISRVVAQPSPLLVPLVEEGWLDHRITRAVVEEYTAPLVREGIDTLVLGCTHYPLIKKVLMDVVGESVTLVDSAEATASEVSSMLESKGLSSDSDRGESSYYVSDIPLKFQEIAQRFLGRSVPLVTQVEVGE